MAAEQSKFVESHAEGDRPLLEVKNVVAAYRGSVQGDRRRLDHLRRGETLAIVGESGSGKSTLARVIVGLLPRASRATCCSTATSLRPRLQDRSKDQLRRIQMIYQMPDVALNPRQTLLDIIGRPVQFYFGKSRRGGARAASRSCCARSTCRRITSPAGRMNCRAARSSASASPARWRPSPT